MIVQVIFLICLLCFCAAIIFVIDSSEIDDIEEYKRDKYNIVSDPGDEVEHIYNKK